MHHLSGSPAVFICKFISGKSKRSILFLQKCQFPFQLFRHPQIIGIQIGDISALRLLQSTVPGPCGASVGRLMNHPDSRVLSLFQIISYLLHSSVSAAILHQKQLPVRTGLCLHTVQSFCNIFFHIIYRYYNTDQFIHRNPSRISEPAAVRLSYLRQFFHLSLSAVRHS